MKFATIHTYNGRLRPALIDTMAYVAAPILRVAGRDVADLCEVVERLGANAGGADAGSLIELDEDVIDLSEVRYAAPFPTPRRNILCVDGNYHAPRRGPTAMRSNGASLPAAVATPSAPIVFTKFPQTVIATGEPIRVPAARGGMVDCAAALAVVIGKAGKDISREQAWSHVFGYSIVNEVTARDTQRRHGDCCMGNLLDTLCPFGPWIVSAEAVQGDNLQLCCWVNGQLRQQSNTRNLVFDIPTLIAVISEGMTLLPGDVITTGTPEPVGMGLDPQGCLAPGDLVTIEIEGLGELENPVG